MKFQFYISLIFFLVISCWESTTSKKNSTGTDTLNVEFISNQDDTLRQYAFIKFKQQKIGLDSIQGGYDSLQFRIWDLQGLFGHMEVYVIKNNQYKWTAEYYSIHGDSNFNDGLILDEFEWGDEPFNIVKQKQLMPRIPWKKFVDSLISFDIMILPDMESVKGMEVTWTDGSWIVIEVANKNGYRVYHYNSPHRFEKFEEANKIEGILSLISNELEERGDTKTF